MTFFKKNAEHMLQVIHLIATAISSSCYDSDNITSLAIVKVYNKVDSSTTIPKVKTHGTNN